VPRLLLLIHRGERDSGGVINSADACPRKINSTDGVGSEKAAVWTCRAGGWCAVTGPSYFGFDMV
jgi:hypothetical protein